MCPINQSSAAIIHSWIEGSTVDVDGWYRPDDALGWTCCTFFVAYISCGLVV